MELRSDMDRIVAETAESHDGVVQFRHSCENSLVGTRGIRHAESSVSNPINRTGRGLTDLCEYHRIQSADKLHSRNVRLGGRILDLNPRRPHGDPMNAGK